MDKYISRKTQSTQGWQLLTMPSSSLLNSMRSWWASLAMMRWVVWASIVMASHLDSCNKEDRLTQVFEAVWPSALSDCLPQNSVWLPEAVCPRALTAWSCMPQSSVWLPEAVFPRALSDCLKLYAPELCLTACSRMPQTDCLKLYAPDYLPAWSCMPQNIEFGWLKLPALKTVLPKCLKLYAPDCLKLYTQTVWSCMPHTVWLPEAVCPRLSEAVCPRLSDCLKLYVPDCLTAWSCMPQTVWLPEAVCPQNISLADWSCMP